MPLTGVYMYDPPGNCNKEITKKDFFPLAVHFSPNGAKS